MAQAHIIETHGLPLEGFDGDSGGVKWNTIFDADRTETAEIACGIAHVGPGQNLNLHRHRQAEVYFGLEGEAIVTIDDEQHLLAPGVAIFVPGEALHGVFGTDGPARFFYTFATSTLANVDYRFLAQVPAMEAEEVVDFVTEDTPANIDAAASQAI